MQHLETDGVHPRHIYPGGTLRDPKSIEDLGAWAKRHMTAQKPATGFRGISTIEEYKSQYRKGWTASNRGSENTPFQDGTSTWAFDDGYLDAAAGRQMWHYAYCEDPDDCPADH